jgi:hypothetical protein
MGVLKLLGELSLEEGKYKLRRTGLAFATKIRYKKGSLYSTIPKQICLGCDLRKGQELIHHLVHYGDGKMGLFIPLENTKDSI